MSLLIVLFVCAKIAILSETCAFYLHFLIQNLPTPTSNLLDPLYIRTFSVSNTYLNIYLNIYLYIYLITYLSVK